MQRSPVDLVRRVVPPRIRQPFSTIRCTLTMKYLFRDLGLFRSMRTGRSVDASGRPLPWYTFSAIAWLEQLDFTEAEVFEYGTGQSTLWWSERARLVAGVEHDRRWHSTVASMVSGRADVQLETDPERYIAAGSGRAYDVVVVDGIHRDRCAAVAADGLKPGGALILDNAERYPSTCAHLRARGLLEIDFAGFGPLNFYRWTTSVFLDRTFDRAPTGVQPRVPIGGVPEDVVG